MANDVTEARARQLVARIILAIGYDRDLQTKLLGGVLTEMASDKPEPFREILAALRGASGRAQDLLGNTSASEP